MIFRRFRRLIMTDKIKKSRIFFIPAVIIIVLVLISACQYGIVNEKVVIEAGSGYPNADLFIKDKARPARFITDISAINMNEPGIYDVIIESGGKEYKVKLEIVDTTAPEADTINLDLYESRNVEPAEFISNVKDATEVNVSYITAPDYNKTGNQEIMVLLEDTSGNKTEYKAVLRISKVKEITEVEISGHALDAGLLLKDQKDLKEVHMDTLFIPDKLGDYIVEAKVGDVIYETTVRVVDTIAPTGTPVDRTFWTNDKIEASDFVENIEDASNVTVSFKEEPDLTKTGEQTVKILLTDEGKNETQLEAKLFLKEDTEPPVIYGLRDNIVNLNTPIAYKKGILAFDNRDGEVSVEVDSSKVNLRQEGSYPVIYSATDSSGNKTQHEVTFTVRASEIELVDREVVEALANEILSKIIKDDMTMEEKALAIYKYINKNVYYLGGRHCDDMITEAYYGMLEDPGDCYTYFAVSDLFLNMVGIPNIRVERLRYEGESNHYWHMINCGNGWYHFDPSVHKPAFFSFMLTDAEAEAYSRQKGKNAYYYRHDKTKYPATPEK
jgi:hypothetical protein